MVDSNRIAQLKREADYWGEMSEFFDQQAANCQKAGIEAKRWGGNGAEMFAAQRDYERQAAEAMHKRLELVDEIRRLQSRS